MASKPNTSGASPFLIALLVIIIGIEALLQAADIGLIGTQRWRSMAYEYGAFWPGLLGNWNPNFFGQSVTMFVTYAFFHNGLSHLTGNAIMLWILGHRVAERIGELRLLIGLLGTSLGGALCFALLSRGIQPMVGTSGAIFGLIGVLTIWLWTPHGKIAKLFTIFGICFSLIVLNLLTLWWQNGELAWQTHLGGFVVGIFLGPWLKRKGVLEKIQP